MEISGSLVRILILLLPGGLACSLYWKLTGRNSQKDWEDLLDIILFSLVSYGVFGLVLNVIKLILPSIPRRFSAFAPFLDSKQPLDLWEIVLVCFVAILLSIGMATATNGLWLFRLARRFKITSRVNELDVWTYLNDHLSNSRWVIVRDQKLGLTYRGWIGAYSDSAKERELLLQDVDVFSDGAEPDYSMASLYLSRNRDDLSIELETPVEIKKNDGTIKDQPNSEKPEPRIESKVRKQNAHSEAQDKNANA